MGRGFTSITGARVTPHLIAHLLLRNSRQSESQEYVKFFG